MPGDNEAQDPVELERSARQFAERSAAMQREAAWALGIKIPDEGPFAIPPEWVGNAIRLYVRYALGNPEGPPAAKVLDTKGKRDAATIGVKDAIETLAKNLPSSFSKPEYGVPVGGIFGDALSRLVSETAANTTKELEEISEERTKFTAQEAVEFERIKVKGMELIIDADSLRSDILIPRIEILYALWHFWREVMRMASIAEVHRHLEKTCKSKFTLKLTEKICREIGLRFRRVKKRAK
jgi:hypothetical protein